MKLIFTLESFLWQGPMLWGLLGCHVFFTLRLKGIQRHTLRGIRLSLQGDRGDSGISAFGALSTSLAAAMGTGNIIGMASAILLGGPGAAFWCWVTGLLGMATRYAETVLTLKYRAQSPGGPVLGGPMYVMEQGMGKPWLGKLFSLTGVLGAMGTGAMIQSNALGTCLREYGFPLLPVALILTAGAALVILGGAKNIAACCEKLVPAMGLLYLLGCAGVLFRNRDAILPALSLMTKSAFTPRAAGGGFVGSTLGSALGYGVARGLFTNESGMGTGPMASAAGPCRTPEAEGLSAMTGVFWDTVVVCGLTSVTLISAIINAPEAFAGAGPDRLCAIAFSAVPGGAPALALSLCVFAFATVVGWSFYGECCARYLWQDRGILPYRLFYLAAVFCGVFLDLEVLWSLGAILVGLMALPNLWCLISLRAQIK